MPIGLVGRKCGMTRIFTEIGESIPVTVIEALPNRVAQVKNEDRDGYRAIQVTVEARRRSIAKPQAGHFEAAKVEPGNGLWEFRLAGAEGDKLALGEELKVDLFQDGQLVDVIGTPKGKGFAGVMKRHNFSGNRASHGVSVTHRSHGSTGQNQDPGKVFKGKKMAGHMGNKVRTIQNLEIIKSDLENNLIFVKGSVPGSKNSIVLIQKVSKQVNRTTTLENLKKTNVQVAPKSKKETDKKTEKNNDKSTIKKEEKK
mgnify:CR=1 FL=1